MTYEEAQEIVEKVINEEKMDWDYESMDFVLNNENTSFDNLKLRDTNNKHTRLLIQSGLPSKNKSDAFKIMTKLSKELGVTPERQHRAIVDYMKKKSFFSDTSERQMDLMRGINQSAESISQLNSFVDALEKSGLSLVK